MTSKKVVEEGSVGGKKTEGGREREREMSLEPEGGRRAAKKKENDSAVGRETGRKRGLKREKGEKSEKAEGRRGERGENRRKQRVIDFCRGFASRYPLYPRLCGPAGGLPTGSRGEATTAGVATPSTDWRFPSPGGGANHQTVQHRESLLHSPRKHSTVHR